MSKDRKKAIDRVTAFWRRFCPYVTEIEEAEARFPLVLLLSALIQELPPKLYDNVEERLKRVLEKGGKIRT